MLACSHRQHLKCSRWVWSMHTTICLYSLPGAPCQPVCSPVSWSIPSSEEFSSQKSRCLLSFPIDLAPCPVYAPPKQHSVYICFSKIPLSPPGSSHQYFLDFFQQPPGGSCFYSSTIIFKYITVQPPASLKYLNHKCCTPI